MKPFEEAGPGTVAARPRVRRGRSVKAVGAALVLMLAMLPAALAAPKGGNKPPGGGGSELVPVGLANPPGCVPDTRFSRPGLNTGAAPSDVIVVAPFDCNSLKLPYYWQSGQWHAIGLLPGGTSGYAEGVSDAVAGPASISGVQFGGGEQVGFVHVPGGAVDILPLPAGFTEVVRAIVTADGAHVVGGTGGPASGGAAVRWLQDAGTGLWIPELIDNPRIEAWAASDDGSVVIGWNWVWMDGDDSPQPLGGDLLASDVSPDGSVLAGFSLCPTSACASAPLYWTYDGAWTPAPLAALDPGYSARALGVGEFDGKPVIVGTGRTKRDATPKALAWMPDSDGNYGTPLRLAPLGGRANRPGQAYDINGHGQVVGVSQGKGLDAEYVIWALPP